MGAVLWKDNQLEFVYL